MRHGFNALQQRVPRPQLTRHQLQHVGQQCGELTPAPAGLYDVAVELSGYRPGQATSLHVNGNETARVEIVLERRAPGESSY